MPKHNLINSVLMSLSLFLQGHLLWANSMAQVGSHQVDKKLLLQVTCSTDAELDSLLKNKLLVVIDENKFRKAREETLKNLEDPFWIPLSESESQDYCSLTTAILESQQTCLFISTERIRNLNQLSCTENYWAL